MKSFSFQQKIHTFSNNHLPEGDLTQKDSFAMTPDKYDVSDVYHWD